MNIDKKVFQEREKELENFRNKIVNLESAIQQMKILNRRLYREKEFYQTQNINLKKKVAGLEEKINSNESEIRKLKCSEKSMSNKLLLMRSKRQNNSESSVQTDDECKERDYHIEGKKPENSFTKIENFLQEQSAQKSVFNLKLSQQYNFSESQSKVTHSDYGSFIFCADKKRKNIRNF